MAYPSSPWKLLGSFTVSSLMAERLFQCIKTSGAFGRETLLTTDLHKCFGSLLWKGDLPFHVLGLSLTNLSLVQVSFAGAFCSSAVLPVSSLSHWSKLWSLGYRVPSLRYIRLGLWKQGANERFPILRACDFGVCLCCWIAVTLLMFVFGLGVYHWLTSRIRTLKLIFWLKGMFNERK